MKLTAAVLVALLVNILLFWLMQQMVTQDEANGTRSLPEILNVDFVRIKQEPEQPPAEIEDDPEMPPPETPPPGSTIDAVSVNKPDLNPPLWKMPSIDLPLNLAAGPYLGDFHLQAIEIPSEPLPLMRVAPQYPQRALMRRIEGQVRVAFTINPDGSVSDPEVIEAEPPGYFEQSALRAIRHWKFQPKIAGGVAVAHQATQTIRYALQN